MRLDFPVAQRLRDRGIVHFAVAVATVADHVDDHRRAERVAIFDRHPADAHDGVRILRVHMENRNLQPLGQVGRKTRRTSVSRHGGESDEVVHNNMDRAAHRESSDAAHIQRLGADSLARESGVAVHADRDDLAPASLAAARLLGPRAAHQHRIDRLEMARIRHQMHFHHAPVRRVKISRRAHVVFHVAAAERASRIDVFESREKLRRRTAHDVHHHVEPPAMAHRYHGFFGALFRRGVQNRIEQRQQRRFALERIALRAQITRLQYLLENLRPNQ